MTMDKYEPFTPMQSEHRYLLKEDRQMPCMVAPPLGDYVSANGQRYVETQLQQCGLVTAQGRVSRAVQWASLPRALQFPLNPHPLDPEARHH